MFKVNNKDATGVVLVSLLLTSNIFHIFFSASIVNFEQVNANWDVVMSNECVKTFFFICDFRGVFYDRNICKMKLDYILFGGGIFNCLVLYEKKALENS